MKINKILLGLAVAMLGVMTSCNTDVEGVTYSPMGQNVSFETSAPATVTTAETSVVIPVRIVRSVVANEYTANFTTKASEEGIFTNDANGAVKFEAGQGVAIINVKADNLAKCVDYTYTLKLSEAEVAGRDTITNTQNDSIVIKIHSDYNWISGGSCTFVDYTFAENGQGAKDVPIQHAEGTNLYRIVQPFIAVYGKGGNGFTTDTGIQFTLNNDYTINLVANDDDIVCSADQYDFCWVKKYEGSYCILQCNGNVYQASMLGLDNGDGYYTGFSFAFQWTTGWPGQK
jgi:hypothetical protein